MLAGTRAKRLGSKDLAESHLVFPQKHKSKRWSCPNVDHVFKRYTNSVHINIADK